MPPEVLESPVEVQEAPSLRETLEKVVEQTPIEAPEPDRETRQQSENDPARQFERARGPDGKFAPKEPKNDSAFPSAREVQQATEPQPDQDTEQPQQAEVAPNIDNAPRSWKAGAKEKWATVDPDVRAEVHRRERESARAIQESAPVKKFAQEFSQAIQPHAQRYQGSGMTPLQVMSNLMQADAILSGAPMAQRATFMAKLIKDYQIDIRSLDAALSGGDPGTEPLAVVEQLINQRLAPLQEFVQTTQQSRQQAVQREYSQQENLIERMAQDSTNFPHFDLVTQDMADVMELNSRRGIYLSPEEAYKRAVAMNPQAQAAEQGRAGQQRAQVAHDAATRSLGASLSVSGSSAGLKQTVAPDDLRGTIEAAWAAAHGR